MKVDKITTLIFVNSFRLGGSERQAVELIKQIDRAYFDIAVACFQKDGPLLRELPPDLVAFESFPLTSFRNWNTCRQAISFMALLRRKDVKVVQCFDFYSNVFAIPLARLVGVPVIVGSRRDEARMRTRAQHRAERISYHFATAVVANAQTLKDQLVGRDGVCERKVRVICNGVDPRRFDGGERISRNDNVLIAVLANLRPEKGHLVFLQAARCLIDRGLPIKFVIAGDGPMRQIIQEKIRDLSLSEHVRMTGVVENAAAFLRTIDILALPSLKNEGFPNAVMEAMAAGKAVVATGTGGATELVVDGLTGYIVRPTDSGALADKLAWLVSDPEMRLKMGEAGRCRVLEQFTIHKMARQFEELYTTLLRTRV